jgi:putative ABC transport system substrate-binding protein
MTGTIQNPKLVPDRDPGSQTCGERSRTIQNVSDSAEGAGQSGQSDSMKPGNRQQTLGDSKKRKLVVCALSVVLFALFSPVEAQQPEKIPRIGYHTGSLGTAAKPDPTTHAFRQRLKELGYIEGKNIAIEFRVTEGKGPAFEAEQARELVRLNVDVLVASAYPAIRAAKEATRTVPIVMVTTQDPVTIGLIDSLARPGGNVTGVTQLARELSDKRLELMLEMVPTLSRVGIVVTKESINAPAALKRYEEAAGALKVELRALELGNLDSSLTAVFDAALKARVGGIIPIRNGRINRLAPRIADLAIKNRLPTMFERTGAVEIGGLAAYTADELEGYRRAAVYVDRILKGAKPAELPVEQPTKFELVINLKTAKQIGVTIPPNVLARADRVIR